MMAMAASQDATRVFTSDQVQRLTGITRRKLDYWLKAGVVTAEIDAAKGRGRVRLYSFQNLIEIRTALFLRDLVSLQLLRKLVGKLRVALKLESPLAEVSLGVIRTGRARTPYRVVVKGPDGQWEHWESGQLFMEFAIPVQEFASQLASAAERDRRARRQPGKIERRRGVLGSAPVLAGTRIPTRAIWSYHQAGFGVERILEDYPGLTEADVHAAIELERGQQRSA
jgi:uncharacterized protein (DUF433 family)